MIREKYQYSGFTGVVGHAVISDVPTMKARFMKKRYADPAPLSSEDPTSPDDEPLVGSKKDVAPYFPEGKAFAKERHLEPAVYSDPSIAVSQVHVSRDRFFDAERDTIKRFQRGDYDGDFPLGARDRGRGGGLDSLFKALGQGGTTKRRRSYVYTPKIPDEGLFLPNGGAPKFEVAYSEGLSEQQSRHILRDMERKHRRHREAEEAYDNAQRLRDAESFRLRRQQEEEDELRRLKEKLVKSTKALEGVVEDVEGDEEFHEQMARLKKLLGGKAKTFDGDTMGDEFMDVGGDQHRALVEAYARHFPARGGGEGEEAAVDHHPYGGGPTKQKLYNALHYGAVIDDGAVVPMKRAIDNHFICPCCGGPEHQRVAGVVTKAHDPTRVHEAELHGLALQYKKKLAAAATTGHHKQHAEPHAKNLVLEDNDTKKKASIGVGSSSSLVTPTPAHVAGSKSSNRTASTGQEEDKNAMWSPEEIARHLEKTAAARHNGKIKNNNNNDDKKMGAAATKVDRGFSLVVSSNQQQTEEEDDVQQQGMRREKSISKDPIRSEREMTAFTFEEKEMVRRKEAMRAHQREENLFNVPKTSEELEEERLALLAVAEELELAERARAAEEHERQRRVGSAPTSANSSAALKSVHRSLEQEGLFLTTRAASSTSTPNPPSSSAFSLYPTARQQGKAAIAHASGMSLVKSKTSTPILNVAPYAGGNAYAASGNSGPSDPRRPVITLPPLPPTEQQQHQQALRDETQSITQTSKTNAIKGNLVTFVEPSSNNDGTLLRSVDDVGKDEWAKRRGGQYERDPSLSPMKPIPAFYQKVRDDDELLLTTTTTTLANGDNILNNATRVLNEVQQTGAESWKSNTWPRAGGGARGGGGKEREVSVVVGDILPSHLLSREEREEAEDHIDTLLAIAAEEQKGNVPGLTVNSRATAVEYVQARAQQRQFERENPNYYRELEARLSRGGSEGKFVAAVRNETKSSAVTTVAAKGRAFEQPLNSLNAPINTRTPSAVGGGDTTKASTAPPQQRDLTISIATTSINSKTIPGKPGRGRTIVLNVI